MLKGLGEEGCTLWMCHTVTCKDYERKECIYGGEERERGLRNSILMTTLNYGSQTWTPQCTCLRKKERECGVTRWEGESNESVYERCDMGPCANGVKFCVMEWVQIDNLRWLSPIKRKKSEECEKRSIRVK